MLLYAAIFASIAIAVTGFVLRRKEKEWGVWLVLGGSLLAVAALGLNQLMAGRAAPIKLETSSESALAEVIGRAVASKVKPGAKTLVIGRAEGVTRQVIDSWKAGLTKGLGAECEVMLTANDETSFSAPEGSFGLVAVEGGTSSAIHLGALTADAVVILFSSDTAPPRLDAGWDISSSRVAGVVYLKGKDYVCEPLASQ